MLQPKAVPRRRFLSGFSALVVLLASMAAVEIRPQAANPLAWRGATNTHADLEIITSVDRNDTRLVRTLSLRARLPGASPSSAASAFAAFLFALPLIPALPAPQTGRAQGKARLVLAPASFRPGASSARGPPRRAFA